MKTAIYPGSFDPITLGHINIIKRAANAFDKVIVCISVNSEKNGGLFTPEERLELMRKCINVENVEFDINSGLVAEYARQKGARVLVKGLRAVSDYEQEVQMAIINSKINPDLDTIFFPSSEKYTYLSSSVAKEMARYNADLSEFLPREILEDVKKKLTEK
ncbi:MAG: pantetheine-phosphate adenylyltransferase [Ruminiclostridium sp.]|nr:pantetheine-phosphate adenylyltransferase [Ruminiclostridium sp.]MBQ9852322.1 pantetheine-phosphate adenylyltransferase [Ruminiclostridium sp.]MBQ9932295.1 pantetheine-phosphate adenylyltransferase [Ruminiclostridium sp.]MBR2490209.1 pantetheine-phosphate adenylyltransferase [Ruminiclostridium sp.]MBR3752368.1 pantetheine-phosphate adenylyltransferase [Ruminiclostridium sp.]